MAFNPLLHRTLAATPVRSRVSNPACPGGQVYRCTGSSQTGYSCACRSAGTPRGMLQQQTQQPSRPGVNRVRMSASRSGNPSEDESVKKFCAWLCTGGELPSPTKQKVNCLWDCRRFLLKQLGRVEPLRPQPPRRTLQNPMFFGGYPLSPTISFPFYGGCGWPVTPPVPYSCGC